jgi:hypothetical protein
MNGAGSDRASVPHWDSIPSHCLTIRPQDRKDEILIFLSSLLLKRSTDRDADYIASIIGAIEKVVQPREFST